jgi:hypothetical protein
MEQVNFEQLIKKQIKKENLKILETNENGETIHQNL